MTRRSRKVWRRSYRSLGGLGERASAIAAIDFEYADKFSIVDKPLSLYVPDKAGPFKTLTCIHLSLYPEKVPRPSHIRFPPSVDERQAAHPAQHHSQQLA
jgi:hypothetical protein